MLGNFPEFGTTSGNAHSAKLLVATQGVTKLDAFPKAPLMKVGEKNK